MDLIFLIMFIAALYSGVVGCKPAVGGKQSVDEDAASGLVNPTGGRSEKQDQTETEQVVNGAVLRQSRDAESMKQSTTSEAHAPLTIDDNKGNERDESKPEASDASTLVTTQQIGKNKTQEAITTTAAATETATSESFTVSEAEPTIHLMTDGDFPAVHPSDLAVATVVPSTTPKIPATNAVLQSQEPRLSSYALPAHVVNCAELIGTAVIAVLVQMMI